MNFIREFVVGSNVPTDVSYSCFFQAEDAYYALVAQRKSLFCCREGMIEEVRLVREYSKIVPNQNDSDFFAYRQTLRTSEISIYRLNSCFQELDCIKIKKNSGCCSASDMWLDGNKGFLYLVYPGIILQYNCNGDYLGGFMGAPMGTTYCALCTFEKFVFVAYRNNNCTYVGMYCCDGSFKEHICLGAEYRIFAMQVIREGNSYILRLFVNKKEAISLFYDLNFCESDKATDTFCMTSPFEKEAKEEEIETRSEPEMGIKVEIIKGNGVGEATCHLKQT